MNSHCASLGKVLVLNANYEPMAICSTEKATVLLYLDKVELVVADESRMLRSQRTSLPFPSVVRVQSFVKQRFKKVALTKRNILRRDGYECQYCGSERELTVDHIMPQSRGGEDSWTNLTTACKRCNNAKNDRTPDEAGLKIRKRPGRPSHVFFLRAMSKEVSSSWEPYLFN